MTKEVRRPVSPLPENPTAVTKRSAVLAALSFLAASMGLSLNDAAKGDVTVNKAKTADKAFSAMDDYIKGRKVNPGSTGPTAPLKPAGGVSRRK